MDQKKQLAKNTLIIALGKGSTQLLGLVLLPLYTTFLSPGEFGTVDLIITYIALFVPIITLQHEMAAFRFLIDARGDERQKSRVITSTLASVVTALAVFVALYLAVAIFVEGKYLLFILLNIIVAPFANLFLQFARGLGENKRFAVASFVTTLTTVIAVVCFIVLGKMGAGGVLLSLAVAHFATATYLFISLKLHRYIRLSHNDKQMRSQLMRYALPLVPNGMSWWVINVSDRTIISLMIGVAANGIYAVSNKFAAIFTGIFSIFSLSWTESASLHIDSKNRDSFFSDTFNASIKLFGALGLVLIAGVPLVFDLLVADAFGEAYLYIPVLIAAAFFNAIVGLYSAVYVAKKMTGKVANTSILAAVINIVLTLALIKPLGLYAAAASTAIAYLAMAIYRHYDLKKHIKLVYQKGIFIKLTALYGLVTALYYWNNPWANIVNVVVVAAGAIFMNRSMLDSARKVLVDAARSR